MQLATFTMIVAGVVVISPFVVIIGRDTTGTYCTFCGVMRDYFGGLRGLGG